MIIIAHRGASRKAPENTGAAIRRALNSQVDMIELDVQLTQDNRLVVFHDERLERTTNGRGALARWRYRNLARLDCGSGFSPAFAGERILLASQAIRAIPASTIANLELKRTSKEDAMIRTLVRCLEWTRGIGRVLISSFETSLLARLKRQRPQVARALLCRRGARQALRTAHELGCVAIHPHVSLATPAWVARAHADGLQVHVWTVDHVKGAERLIEIGVDGIVTNVPDRLVHLR